MTKVQWAIIHFFVVEGFLSSRVWLERLETIQEAERIREDYLFWYPKLNPQMLKVIQYETP